MTSSSVSSGVNLLLNKRNPTSDFNFPNELEKFKFNYQESKKEILINDILNDKFQHEKNLRNKSDLLKNMRLIRHLVNTQSTSQQIYNHNLANQYYHYDLPIDGPIINFLSSLPISVQNITHPKKLQFLYFERKLGKKYYRDFIHGQQKILSIHYKKSKKIIKSKLYNIYVSLNKNKKPTQKINNSGFFNNIHLSDYLKSNLNGLSSPFIERVENKILQEFLNNKYKEIIEGKCTDEILINQLLNIEVFLRQFKK